MLEIKIYDHNKKLITKENPLAVTLQKNLYIPADDITVIIPYRNYSYGTSIELYRDNTLIFVGLIDEEIVYTNSTGSFRKYVARTKASLLLDNQAYPMELDYPCQSYLGYTYLKPFDIPYEDGEKIYSGAININNGKTIYDVLYEYCSGALGTVPRITSKGEFLFNGGETQGEIFFSNRNGIKYNSITEYKRQCNQISKVNVKLQDSYYNSVCENEETLNTGIVRERYVDGRADSVTLAIQGDYLIKNSNKNSFLVEVVCPGCLTEELGKTAFTDTENSKDYTFTVADIKYVYNSKGETTTLALERKI